MSNQETDRKTIKEEIDKLFRVPYKRLKKAQDKIDKKILNIVFEYKQKELLDLIDGADAAVQSAKDSFEIQAKHNAPQELLFEFIKAYEIYYKESIDLRELVLSRNENILDKIIAHHSSSNNI